MKGIKLLFGASVLVSWALLTALFIVGLGNAGPVTPASGSLSSSPVSAADASNIISASELARHTSQNDCWLTIGGKVYDVTSYLPNHPGGPGTIIPYCGKDATAAFAGLPHSQNAQSLLASYYVGDLGQNSSGPQPVPDNGSPVSLAPFNNTPVSPKPQPSSTSFSPAQVGLHGSQGDCWLIVGGSVYDVTSYIPYHPGGPATIIPYCGKDATAAFTGLPHSQNAANLLASYYKGVLVSSQPSVPALSIYSTQSTVTVGTPASVVFTVTSAGSPVGGAAISLGGVAAGSGTTAADGTVSLSVNAVSVGAVTATASKAGYTNGITTLTAISPPPPANSLPAYSLADIASHNSQSTCWMIFSGKVYDVTSYLPMHPGGVAAILPYCGADGTAAFTGLPHSQNAANLLASYLIGVVGNPPPQSTPVLGVSVSPASVTVGISASVTFSVTSAGAPVSGALVSLSGSASGSGTTAANGVITISVNASAAGTITATASKSNYTSGSAVLSAVSPPPPPSGNSSNVTYSLAQVALHNSQSSCWMIVSGNVYDVTSYLPFHPGGVAAILPYCGADGTAAFTGLPHSQNAATLLASYFIGVVGNASSPPPVPNLSLSVFASPSSVTVGNRTPVVFTVTTNGSAVGGVLVSLSGSASGSGTTAANGRVTINVNASTAGYITATAARANYTTGVVLLSASLPPPPVNSTPTYSLSQVALHNSQSSCWMIVSGNVYDVTSYLPFHPGGVAAILPYCGADGTAAFTGLPHSQNAATLLASYFIGVVGNVSSPPPAFNVSLSVSATPSNVTVGSLASVTFNVTGNGSAVGGALVSLSGSASGSGTTASNGVVVISVNATSAGYITATATRANYTSGVVLLSASLPPPPVNSTPTYTLSQVALHNSQSSCWMVVSGNVYDVTSYLPFHPGGVAAILPYCGTDGTAAFTGLPHSQNAANLLASYFIGVLGTTPPPPVSNASLTISASPASVTVGVSTSVTFTVSSNGTAVGGALVTLSGSATGSGTTAANGMVTINVRATSAGTVTATATKANYTSGTVALSAVSPPPGDD